MGNKFQFQVTTELEALEKIWQWFETITKPLLSEQAFNECRLALTEGFTNAVRHAHQNFPATTPIDLEIKLMPQYIEMKIWDRGEYFDIETKLKSLKKNQIHLLWQEGGNGLKFMEQVTDDLKYIRFSKNKNCLVMRKKVEYGTLLKEQKILSFPSYHLPVS